MTYVQGYPQDGSTLGQSKAQIRTNLDSTFQTLGVDHINNNGDPGSQPRGYHTVAHFVPQAGDPAAIAGYGQLYSKSVNSVTTDTALFWETGAGLITQLTSNFTPTASTNGKTFLPGGIIMQWGSGTSPDSTSVNFNMTFPTTLYSLTLSHSQSGTGENTQTVVSAQLKTTSGFLFRTNGASGNTTYSYVAIGK